MRITWSIMGALILASACATPTPYQPVERGSASQGGFAEQRIESDRYRVSFTGNSMTSRDTVETYLLYRAAELTRARGFDWFVMVDRATDKRSRTYVDQPFGPGRWGYWGPSWRYFGRGFGWRNWDPYGGDPFWDRQVDVRTVDRYEAVAEIVMRRGARPVGNPRAFDAREVLDNLGPNIVLPRSER